MADEIRGGFEAVLKAHDVLDAVFLLHQELLLARDLPLALEVLDAHRVLLELHMKHEEELLFPVFERAPHDARFPPVLFRGQHTKMRKLLDDCRENLSRVVQSSEGSRVFVIRLLERETTYKHLVEHHDGAERQGFFPALSAKADASELAELPERCLAQWEHRLTAERPTLERARQRLAGEP